ncbi:MAG: hypothetical protein WBX15_02435 [Thermoanaerobaculia bacterium]
MTLYGENRVRFRRGPSSFRLFVVSAASHLLGFELASLFVAGVIRLIAPGYASFPPSIYAPFLDDPLRAPWAAQLPSSAPTALVTSLASLVFAFIVVWLWPLRQSLAGRFFSLALGLDLVIVGALANAFQPPVFSLGGRNFLISPLAWAVLTGAIAVWEILLLERRTIEILAGLYEMDLPSERLIRWMLRIPLAFGIGAAGGWLTGYHAATFAFAVAAVVTLLENASRVPRLRFEQFAGSELREAAAVLPLLAVALVAAAIFAFGLPAVEGHWPLPPRRALVWSEAGPDLRLLSRIPRPAGATGGPHEGEETRIEIRWSKQPERPAKTPGNNPPPPEPNR